MKRIVKIKNSQKGFTLVELVISIFVLVVGVIGVYNALSVAIIYTGDISSRLTAAYLAQEGIEIIRNIRDNNWLKIDAGEPINWDDGLSNCYAPVGCEADYKTGTAEEVSGLTPFSGGNNLNLSDNGFYSYDSTGSFSPTKFKRKITITVQTPDSMLVNVLVTWEEKEDTLNFEAEEYIYNWY